MRLLIITQKIDNNDPVLGFFHTWVTELAKRFKKIVVICLFKTETVLPDNVTVLSLGKEKWKSKTKYVFLLFYFSIRYANRYDAVFVHMNKEYAVLAGWMWRLMGKKVYMWRNHHIGNIMTDIASIFCNKVFCTSKYSYTAKYKKTVLMPVGFDASSFKSDILSSANKGIPKISRSILSLGRIAPSKNIDILVETLGLLKKRGVDFIAHIYGDPFPKDIQYWQGLKKRASELGLDGVLVFKPGIAKSETPVIYSSHEIFINLSSDGMYDKTIFESMACGCITLASNGNLKGQVDDNLVLEKREPEVVADHIIKILGMSQLEKEKIIQQNKRFVEKHSLDNLVQKLVEVMR